MDMPMGVQILQSAIYISLNANTFEKGINPTNFVSVINKQQGRLGFLTLLYQLYKENETLNAKLLNSAVSLPVRAEGMDTHTHTHTHVCKSEVGECRQGDS